MTDKTQPTAHAEITAPISADLRGIEGASPVSHAVRLLREAAAELKNWHTIGGDWGDEIEALDAYNEHMAVAATLEQAEAGQAVPAPVTYMATDNACKWAWDHVRKDVGTEGWTTGDSCNFYGFFLWGWNYRGQYETQRPAAPPAPAGVAVPEVTDAMVDAYLLEQRRTVEEADRFGDGNIGALHTNTVRVACRNGLRAALAAAPAQEHATQLAGQGQFQQRVHPWLLECFGAEIAGDKAERNHRFLEEALELVQACGCTVSEAHQLVDYVFGRPVGEPAQEVGGVMVTLAALCYANGLDMHTAGETELERISVPAMMAKIKAKQAAKPKHSPLPVAPAHAQEDARDAVERAERYEDALRHIAENAFANKDWTFAQLILNGHSIDAARAAQGDAA